jgi:ankyrin repeat protein
MFQKKRDLIAQINDYHDAIQKNDLKKIEEIFSKDNPPNIDAEFIGVAPIIYAAQEGYWDLVMSLILKNADLDVKIEPHKWYLLHECVVNAPNQVFKNVVEYSNVNVQNNKGETPLMVGIRKGKLFETNYLLDSERVVFYYTDTNKETALHYAAKYNQYDIFLRLVKRGANIFAKNKAGKTPIDLIEDETFRNSLPKKLEDLNINLEKGAEISDIETKLVFEEIKKPEEIKKISTLSKLTKKT